MNLFTNILRKASKLGKPFTNGSLSQLACKVRIGTVIAHAPKKEIGLLQSLNHVLVVSLKGII